MLSTTTVMQPLAHRAATVGESSAVAITHRTFGFDPNEIQRAERVRITATGEITLRYDGGTPDSNSGHFVPANTVIEIVGQQNIAKLKFRARGDECRVAATLEVRPSQYERA